MASKQRLTTALKYVLTVIVGIAPALTLYVWRPTPVYGLYLYATGRSAENLSETISAVGRTRILSDRIVEYWNRCSLIKEEGGYQLLATPEGELWLPNTCGAMCLMAEQEHDAYGSIVPGDVVIDCGANVGSFTRGALEEGAARVIAIEPAPENLECLRRNFRAEIEQGRVTIIDKGVWDSETVLQFATDNNNSAENSVVLHPGNPGKVIRIPVTTIDRLVEELNLGKVDMIKMDIEGSEKPALRGARRTLAAFKPRLGIATEHLPDDETAIPALIRSIRSDYGVQAAGPKIVIAATNRIGTQILQFK